MTKLTKLFFFYYQSLEPILILPKKQICNSRNIHSDLSINNSKIPRISINFLTFLCHQDENMT